MKFTRGHRSENFEDRRGQGASGGGGGGGLRLAGGSGAVVVVIALVAKLLFGVNIPIPGLSGGGSTGTTQQQSPLPPGQDPDDEVVSRINFAFDDLQATWTQIFAARGLSYKPARLVAFTEATDTACGLGQSAMGPFYCPGDTSVFIDLSFFHELDRRFGAPGDFAQAYVVAHEIGHHVQKLMGTEEKVRGLQRSDRDRENELSVRMELQADCYAGIWAAATKKTGIIEAGDLEEGLQAATAIGDDTLQKRAGGRVVPESFTHGSSAQRVRWFKRGYDRGDVDACDTFRSDQL